MNNTTILSIESSGSNCSAAISQDYILLAEYSIFKPNFHDKILAELVRRLMDDLSITVDSLSAVAVSSGPGSFTGLRIGAAIAKGLTYRNSPKLIAVPTLEAIAYSFQEKSNSRPCTVVSASHKDLAYEQEFNAQAEPIGEIKFLTYNEISELIEPETLILVSGLKEIPQFFSMEKSGGTPVLRVINLTAGLLSKAANKYFKSSRFVDSETFVPNYQQEFSLKC